MYNRTDENVGMRGLSKKSHANNRLGSRWIKTALKGKAREQIADNITDENIHEMLVEMSYSRDNHVLGSHIGDNADSFHDMGK